MQKKCNDKRKCFAQTIYHDCSLLLETYEDGKCPFCKPEKTITNGRAYPWKQEYGKSL